MIPRKKLPPERVGLTKTTTIMGTQIYIRTGLYEDGTLGEVFITVAKEGDEMRLLDLVAISMSVGLQYGIPLEVFTNKFSNWECGTAGNTDDEEIPMIKSIIDYVAKWLQRTYPSIVGRGAWMTTQSGRQFYPYDPRPDEILIEDIAHGLSLLCRYNGQCSHFYSVAQHSVLASLLVPKEDALWALLHDAAEAYIGDMIRPLKHGVVGIVFQHVENKILQAVAERFDLDKTMPESVLKADNIMAATEIRDLLPGQKKFWIEHEEKPHPASIESWAPGFARDTFLARYYALTGNEIAATEFDNVL